MQYINVWQVRGKGHYDRVTRSCDHFETYQDAVDQLVEDGSVWTGATGNQYQYDYTIEVLDDADTATILDLEDDAADERDRQAGEREDYHREMFGAGFRS